MKSLITGATIMAMAALLLPAAATADVPQLMTIQGKLSNAGGPLEGSYSVVFSIYETEVAAVPEWADTLVVDVVAGLFNVVLGEGNPIPVSTFGSDDLWLGIKVADDAEMTPRRRLTTVPYSFSTVSGSGGTGGGWNDDGNVVILQTISDSVGIGTITPEAELHVVGELLVTDKATIGADNTNSADYSFVVGQGNAAQADHATVGGGLSNTANGARSTVSGGTSNIAGGLFSTIGGGQANIAGATAATIPGGVECSALGNYSFAAGFMAKANHDGAFVWSDPTGSFESTGDNQFLISASGGVGINTDSPGDALSVAGIIESETGGFRFPDGTVQTSAATGGTGWADDGDVIRLENLTDSVGIGTSTPEAILDVAGSFNADEVNVGSPTQTGAFSFFRNGSASRVVGLGTFNEGGWVRTYDSGGAFTHSIEPDVDLDGGWLGIWRPGGIGFRVDANYDGTDEPRVTVDGSSRDIVFDMSAAGDASVVLPDNAISSDELLDETGIAAAKTNIGITLGVAGMTDIETVTLTLPTTGYVFLQGKCFVRFSGTQSNNDARIQIDTVTGGGTLAPNYTWISCDSFPSTGDYNYSANVQRVYFLNAGTYTFIMEGITNSNGVAEAFHPQLTALFVPTSYGAVEAFVGAENVDQFDKVTLQVGDDADRDSPGTKQLYKADLRDLELRAARLRAELRKVEMQLDEAQVQKQLRAADEGIK